MRGRKERTLGDVVLCPHLCKQPLLLSFLSVALLELIMVSLLRPGSHPNWSTDPHSSWGVLPSAAQLLTPPLTSCHRPVPAPVYGNYLAPVDICAYNHCPGVGKCLLNTVLSNADITEPTLERLTCIHGSPHHYPFSLARQFPLKWWLGVITRNIITSSHFKKPCIESRLINLRNSPGEKREAFIWCMNILGTVERALKSGRPEFQY